MKKLMYSAGVFVLVLVMAGAANATIIPTNLDIDFRSNDWAGADGVPEFTVDYSGFSVKAWSETGELYQDGIDGLGIRMDETDEIDDFELLTVQFDTSALLDGVWITDLFDPPDGNSEEWGEIGRVNLVAPGGTLIGGHTFYGDDADQGNGEWYVDFGGVEVWQAVFFAVNPGDTLFGDVGASSNNEFSVAGFNQSPTPTPEPATMLLLGSGLVGLAGFGRKKIFKK